MNTAATTETVNPSTQNPKQPQQKQTAAEAIAANVKALIEQLEEGHSDALTAYLTAMGRFHNYSFGNIVEIARQKPDATRVAGLYAWNQLGRKVRKGQHGIHLYHGNASLLAESLEVIQKASAIILSALETPEPEATTTEAVPEPEPAPELAQAS